MPNKQTNQKTGEAFLDTLKIPMRNPDPTGRRPRSGHTVHKSEWSQTRREVILSEELFLVPLCFLVFLVYFSSCPFDVVFCARCASIHSFLSVRFKDTHIPTHFSLRITASQHANKEQLCILADTMVTVWKDFTVVGAIWQTLRGTSASSLSLSPLSFYFFSLPHLCLSSCPDIFNWLKKAFISTNNSV